MNYKCSHCINSVEVFRKFNKNNIKLKKRQFLKEFKTDTKQELAAQVFTYCLYLVTLDIINNNVIFALPNAFGKDSEIGMKVFEDEEFKTAYKRGKFNDIDFIKSNFKGYQLFYRYESSSTVKEKPIYINARLKDMITENANAGKTYY